MQPCPIRSKILPQHVRARRPEVSSGQRETASAVGETRKLAEILVADVVGYSRLAGADGDRTLARLRGLRSDLIDPAIAAHHGRIVKRTGDGSIVAPIHPKAMPIVLTSAAEVDLGLRRTRPGPLRLDRRRPAEGRIIEDRQIFYIDLAN